MGSSMGGWFSQRCGGVGIPWVILMRRRSRLWAEGYSAIQSDFQIETAWVRAGSETGTAFKKKKSFGWREKKIGAEADSWRYDGRALQCVRFCGFAIGRQSSGRGLWG